MDRGKSNHWLSPLAWAALLGLYVGHFAVVSATAVDVPSFDEWEFLSPDLPRLDADLDWAWVVDRHNEHRIVPTKLQVWALYRYDGWDLRTQQHMNFILFGAVLLAVVLVCRRIDPKAPGWAVAAYVAFLLSPAGFENHIWGFQSQFHLALLTFLLAAWALFDPEQRSRSLVLGVAVAWLGIFSQTAALAALLVLGVWFVLFKVLRIRSADHDRRREAIQLAGVAGALALAVLLWAQSYPSIEHHPDLHGPWTSGYWAFFLNEVSFGFGIQRISVGLGLVCLGIVLAPLVALLAARRPQGWLLAGVVLGLLGVLSSIAVGRAGMEVGLLQSKVPRYYHFAAALLPFTYLAWRAALHDRPRVRMAVTCGLWIALATIWARSDTSFSIYQEIARRKRAGLTDIETYYRHGGAGDVPELYPRPIPERLDLAREQRVSFAVEATD